MPIGKLGCTERTRPDRGPAAQIEAAAVSTTWSRGPEMHRRSCRSTRRRRRSPMIVCSAAARSRRPHPVPLVAGADHFVVRGRVDIRCELVVEPPAADLFAHSHELGTRTGSTFGLGLLSYDASAPSKFSQESRRDDEPRELRDAYVFARPAPWPCRDRGPLTPLHA